jgi:hypothetical protein
MVKTALKLVGESNRPKKGLLMAPVSNDEGKGVLIRPLKSRPESTDHDDACVLGTKFLSL